MMILKYLQSLLLILILLTVNTILPQTEEQKRHPKYKELEKHYKAWKEAKNNETFNTEFNKVIELEKEIFGEEHLKTAEVSNRLGQLFLNAGQFDKALQRFQFSLKIRIKFLGENHQDVTN